MRNLRKITSILFILIFAFSLCSCSNYEPDPNYIPPEQPVRYYKDIEAEIIDVETKQWFAGTHWYEVKVTVRSEEYNLEETFEFKGSGSFGKPSEWMLEEGDIVSVELYSWVMESTGEVVKRKINRIN